MPKLPLSGVLLAALALTACTGGTTTPAPAPVAADVGDDDDDGEAVTARDFVLSTTQARALGLGVQAEPAEPLTLRFEIQKGTSKTSAGKTKAYARLTWAKTGQLAGTYDLALIGATTGNTLKARSGSLTLSTPTPKGQPSASSSRSTSYVQAQEPTCATLGLRQD